MGRGWNLRCRSSDPLYPVLLQANVRPNLEHTVQGLTAAVMKTMVVTCRGRHSTTVVHVPNPALGRWKSRVQGQPWLLSDFEAVWAQNPIKQSKNRNQVLLFTPADMFIC